MEKSSHNFTFFLKSSANYKPTVAISSCLVGKPVRYDGGGNLLTTANYLTDKLTLIEVCPEVGAGMSVPRPPIRLVENDSGIEAIGRHDASLKVTAALKQYSLKSVKQLSTVIDGYIFKSRSPSCGINSTPIYTNHDHSNRPKRFGSGVQAHYVQQQMPWLPLREEVELEKTDQCRQFILQCRVYRDLRMANKTASLATIHQHYLPLINTMNIHTQNELKQWQLKEVKEKYWAAFILAMSRKLDSVNS
ncbi:MAG: DUF523 domain-containing protein [Oceanicoccus sp.]